MVLYRYLKRKLHKFIYTLLIYEIIFVSKSKLTFLDKLKKFAELRLNSNKGEFLFTFKEDRRQSIKYIRKYIVEVKVPEDVNLALRTLDDRVAIIVNVLLIRIDYEILAEILYEKYLDEAIKYLKTI